MKTQSLIRQAIATALASALVFGSVPQVLAALPPRAPMREVKAEDLVPKNTDLAARALDLGEPCLCSALVIGVGRYGDLAFLFAAYPDPEGLLVEMLIWRAAGPCPQDANLGPEPLPFPAPGRNPFSGGGGAPSVAKDPLGNRTTMTYDSTGNMTSRTDAANVTTTYTFDTNGNRTAQTTAGRTSRSVYDGMNRLVQSVDALGHSTSTEYNALGQVVATTDKLGATTGQVYNALGKLERTEYADGTSESQGYDPEGRRTSSTDRNGVTTTFVFDAAGQLTRTVRQDGVFTESQYDVAGRVKYQWDAKRNRSEFGYDGAGRRTSVTDALNHTTSFGFDAAGNQTSFTDALNHTTVSTFDALGRQTRSTFHDGTHSDTEYDAAGRRTASIDQAGKRNEFSYDAVGRLTSVTDALNHTWAYGYNDHGERVSQTDAKGQVTRFEFDALGRMTGRTLPLNQSESMTYDPNGNMLSKTNPNGQAVTMAYDQMNRATSRTVPTRGTTNYTYTATGKVETVTDGRGTTRYEHDCVRSCVITRVDNPDGTWLAYEYDGAANRTAMVSPSQRAEYRFDALNRLSDVEQAGQVTHFSYDAVGNRSGVTRPNGTWTEYVYNNLNRLTDIRHYAPGGSVLASYHYDLGAAGNRTGVTEASGRSVAWGYDDLYRLTSETITDAVNGNRSLGYQYDEVGNRLRKTDSVAGETTYSYDGNDRLTAETSGAGTTTYTWDAAGRNTARSGPGGSTTYTWDPEDRMLSAGGVDYRYDAEGLRVGQTVGGVTTSFLLDKVRPYAQVIESRVGDAVAQRFLFGDDLIALSVPGTGSFFYLADGQNSVRALTDAAGAVAASYTFDAFGVELAATEAAGIRNPLRYVGEWAEDGGLVYLRARRYAPTVGRFISADEILDVPSPLLRSYARRPLAFNPFLYAMDNPVNLWDPSGLIPTLGSVQTISQLQSILQPFFPTNATFRPLGPEESSREYIALTVASLIEPPGQRDRAKWTHIGFRVGFKPLPNVNRKMYYSVRESYNKSTCTTKGFAALPGLPRADFLRDAQGNRIGINEAVPDAQGYRVDVPGIPRRTNGEFEPVASLTRWWMQLPNSPAKALLEMRIVVSCSNAAVGKNFTVETNEFEYMSMLGSGRIIDKGIVQGPEDP